MKEEPPNYSEHEIVEGIKNNNEVIITYLIEKLKPYVYRWIMKDQSGTEEQAKDILQDTWLAVISNIKQGKYKEGNFDGYFISISKYIWFKTMKKKKNQVVVNSTDEDVEDHSEEERNLKLLKDKRCEIVYQKLMELDTERRKVLELKFYEGAELKDIADQMKISRKFVKIRLYRCKKYLLDLLRQEPEFAIEEDERSR